MNQVSFYVTPDERYVFRLFNTGALWVSEHMPRGIVRTTVLVPNLYAVPDPYGS